MMNKEECAVIQRCYVTMVEELDPFSGGVVDSLYEKRCISRSQIQELEKTDTRKDMVRKLLEIVVNCEKCTLRAFRQILKESGYGGLATLLLHTKEGHLWEEKNAITTPVAKIEETAPERKANTLAHDLLYVIHSGDEQRYKSLKIELEKVHANNMDLMYAVQDSMLSYCIMNYGNEGFDGKALARDVLKKMETCLNFCVNPTAISLWYLTRKSVMMSLAEEDYRKALDAMDQGLQYLDALAQSRATQFSFILQVYALHIIWEAAVGSPCGVVSDVLDRMDLAMEKGIGHVMQCKEDDQKYFHVRLLYLRWAFVKLGMARSGAVKLRQHPTEEDVRQAGRYLDQVDKYWEGIECRREMFYCMARAEYWKQVARLKTLKPAKSKEYAEQALKKAKRGKFPKIVTTIKSQIDEITDMLKYMGVPEDDEDDLESDIVEDQPSTGGIQLMGADTAYHSKECSDKATQEGYHMKPHKGSRICRRGRKKEVMGQVVGPTVQYRRKPTGSTMYS